MNASPKKTWILSDDLAARVQDMITDGTVAGLDEIVEAGLLAIAAEEPAIDDEALRRAVLPVIEEMDRDPGRAVPAEQVWAEIGAHIARLGKA